jgi:hypothetical protein
MKYVGLVGKIVLALAFGLGLLIATADDPEVASLDPTRPATLLPLITNRVRAVRSYVRDFRASDLIDAATAGLREHLRHERPPEPPAP